MMKRVNRSHILRSGTRTGVLRSERKAKIFSKRKNSRKDSIISGMSSWSRTRTNKFVLVSQSFLIFFTERGISSVYLIITRAISMFSIFLVSAVSGTNESPKLCNFGKWLNPVFFGNRETGYENSGPGGIRTPDIRVRSPALCPS